ncbi:MAG: response regulator transcription factor [Eubacteriales bacterium]|nr:response regulator transcription factor [Eubacteriales bacterium]
MNNSRIMILSCDEKFSQEMALYFRESHYGVLCYSVYTEAIAAFLDGKRLPDIILFDMGTPSGKEYDVIRKIREYSDVRIIVLSEDSRLESQLYAYSMKIDDYMVKPTPFPLLEAHVEAILRRNTEGGLIVKTAGAVRVDFESRKVTLAGKPLILTAKEYDMMSYLVSHQGMVLTRDKILDSVWGFDYVGSYRGVDTLIKNLRAKLTKQYPYIRTIYGVGYCFEVEERGIK